MPKLTLYFQGHVSWPPEIDTQMAIGRDAGTSYNLLQSINDGRKRICLSFDEVLRFKPAAKPIADQSPEYFERWEFMGRSFNLSICSRPRATATKW